MLIDLGSGMVVQARGWSCITTMSAVELYPQSYL